MSELPDAMADLERWVSQTTRFGLRWAIASVVFIVIASVWQILDEGTWPRMLLLLGAGSLLSAQGFLAGFHRGIHINNRAIRMAQRKRAAGGNGGPP